MDGGGDQCLAIRIILLMQFMVLSTGIYTSSGGGAAQQTARTLLRWKENAAIKPDFFFFFKSFLDLLLHWTPSPWTWWQQHAHLHRLSNGSRELLPHTFVLKYKLPAGTSVPGTQVLALKFCLHSYVLISEITVIVPYNKNECEETVINRWAVWPHSLNTALVAIQTSGSQQTAHQLSDVAT